MKRSLKKVIAFLILNFSLCSIFYYILISKGTLKGNQIYICALMMVPAISSIIIKLIYDKNVKGLGWKFGKFKYLIISYLIPLISAFIVYSFVWITGIGGVSLANFSSHSENTIFIQLIFLLTVFFAVGFVFAFGEEVGWRGFLVSELSKHYSYKKTALIISIIWVLYHYPLIIFSDYNGGTPIWFSLLFCTISMIAISFIAVWLRLKSGSLWTGVILHASHNLFIQAFFDVITIDYGITNYITTEFGIGLAAIYTIIAIYFFKNRDKIKLDELPDSNKNF